YIADGDCRCDVTVALALLEGVVLYSAFGFFKGFNSRGFNLIPHFVSGIDASAKDENFHSIASSFLHNECKHERRALGNHTDEEDERLREPIWKMAETLYQPEKRIIDLMFEIPGNRVATDDEQREFVRHRVRRVLDRLQMAKMFDQQ